tara:strand:+ start:2291 stop:2536 length:246 start_codon:yes stop_codon:yes gene_type:complete
MSESKYKHQNGKASLFKNKYKDSESKPDYKGTGTMLDGKEIEIAMWKGETKSGELKLSLTFSEPYVKPGEKSQPKFDGIDL